MSSVVRDNITRSVVLYKEYVLKTYKVDFLFENERWFLERFGFLSVTSHLLSSLDDSRSLRMVRINDVVRANEVWDDVMNYNHKSQLLKDVARSICVISKLFEGSSRMFSYGRFFQNLNDLIKDRVGKCMDYFCSVCGYDLDVFEKIKNIKINTRFSSRSNLFFRHGDLDLHNILVDKNTMRFVAIIDFETSMIMDLVPEYPSWILGDYDEENKRYREIYRDILDVNWKDNEDMNPFVRLFNCVECIMRCDGREDLKRNAFVFDLIFEIMGSIN